MDDPALADRHRSEAVDDEGLTADSITGGALELIHDAEWVSLTLRVRRGRLVTLSSTDARAAELDQQQYALREGPCVDAVSDSGWIRSPDVASDHRWPRWGRLAGRQGVASMLSVQMLARDAVLGALNFYSPRLDGFSNPDEIDVAQLFTTQAASALSSSQQLSGLRTALHSRHHIGMAQGILMERFGMSVPQAFDVLRRYSMERNEPLAHVAEHIVTTRHLPTPD